MDAQRPWHLPCDGPKTLNGLILEFGVAGGTSTRIIAKNAEPRTVHGFDSFEGLPGDWSGTHEQKGRYSQHGKLPRVPNNVKIHKGWVDQTLPGFLVANPGPVSFVNIDCDVYDSTIYVLDQLADRMRVGTLIVTAPGNRVVDANHGYDYTIALSRKPSAPPSSSAR